MQNYTTFSFYQKCKYLCVVLSRTLILRINNEKNSFTVFQAYQTLLRKYYYGPNCALGRRTILCLYAPGFQRQVLEHVQKCKWNPFTKFQWIPRTNTCNVNFVGILILLQIPQRANLGSCSEFRKCKRIPQM